MTAHGDGGTTSAKSASTTASGVGGGLTKRPKSAWRNVDMGSVMTDEEVAEDTCQGNSKGYIICDLACDDRYPLGTPDWLEYYVCEEVCWRRYCVNDE